jgi:hypothetical protein
VAGSCGIRTEADAIDRTQGRKNPNQPTIEQPNNRNLSILMNLSFVLGNFLGRAVISYALIWLVCWMLSRFNWRLAFKRSGRWYSVLAVVLVALLGMAVPFSRSGAGENL